HLLHGIDAHLKARCRYFHGELIADHPPPLPARVSDPHVRASGGIRTGGRREQQLGRIRGRTRLERRLALRQRLGLVDRAHGHVHHGPRKLLGGARESAPSLEQVGTDADCSSAGRPVYSSWFELLPAEAVGVRLAVHPGDRMTASVTVRGHDATLRLRDLSSGGRFTITRRMAKVDVSTAEWIVEAPSICLGTGACRTGALTGCGAVEFSATSATAHGHTGPIADPEWSTTALELRQSSLTGGRRGTAAVGVPSSSLIEASPSSAAGPEGAFAVRWQEQALQGERSAPPTLPGASGAG